jgi:ATP:corrinoid adenosyltransferase
MKILVINKFHNVSTWQFIKGEMDNSKAKRIDKSVCSQSDCHCVTNIYTYLDDTNETEYKWDESYNQWDETYRQTKNIIPW